MSLTEQFSDYSAWRARVGQSISQLKTWLVRNEISDAQSDLRLAYLLDRLRDEKLTVAFAAEFSRGKSELINAIFFAGYGDRILPSSVGRTTMCPTELAWDEGQKPSLRLLPIETRARGASVQEFKPLRRRVGDGSRSTCIRPESLREAMARVGETKRVPAAEAERLGFAIAPGRQTRNPGSTRTAKSRSPAGVTRRSSSPTPCSGRAWSSSTPRGSTRSAPSPS